MQCEEAKLKLNALIDNEIEEDEIEPLILHLAQCSRCRKEYQELVKVYKQLKRIGVPEPAPEWYEEFQKKLLRKISGIGGKVFFIGSYILLIGYTFYQIFVSGDADVFIKVIVGGIGAGFILLLGVSIADRIRESKDDRYRGVIR